LWREDISRLQREALELPEKLQSSSAGRKINAMASELSLTDVSAAITSEYRRIFTERRDDLIAFQRPAGDHLLVLTARQHPQLVVHPARRIGVPVRPRDVDAR